LNTARFSVWNDGRWRHETLYSDFEWFVTVGAFRDHKKLERHFSIKLKPEAGAQRANKLRSRTKSRSRPQVCSFSPRAHFVRTKQNTNGRRKRRRSHRWS
jgi:hypothetical protein